MVIGLSYLVKMRLFLVDKYLKTLQYKYNDTDSLAFISTPVSIHLGHPKKILSLNQIDCSFSFYFKASGSFIFLS